MTPKNAEASRLIQLRRWLKSRNLDGYLACRGPMSFLGNMCHPPGKGCAGLTGFTGSWGMAVIAPKSAALVVDGRYTVQAAQQTKALELKLLCTRQCGT